VVDLCRLQSWLSIEWSSQNRPTLISNISRRPSKSLLSCYRRCRKQGYLFLYPPSFQNQSKPRDHSPSRSCLCSHIGPCKTGSGTNFAQEMAKLHCPSWSQCPIPHTWKCKLCWLWHRCSS